MSEDLGSENHQPNLGLLADAAAVHGDRIESSLANFRLANPDSLELPDYNSSFALRSSSVPLDSSREPSPTTTIRTVWACTKCSAPFPTRHQRDNHMKQVCRNSIAVKHPDNDEGIHHNLILPCL